MELRINKDGHNVGEGLGLSKGRIAEITNSVVDFITPIITEEKEKLDRLELYQHVAKVCHTLEEYTFILPAVDLIIEETVEDIEEKRREEHLKYCPFCRAKERERQRAQHNPNHSEEKDDEVTAGPLKIKVVAPGVLSIRL